MEVNIVETCEHFCLETRSDGEETWGDLGPHSHYYFIVQ